MRGSAVIRVAVLFHSASRCSQWPRQVLFPPDTRTIHVSRPSRSGDAREGEGERIVRQFSVVRGVMLAAGAAKVAAVGVAAATAAAATEATASRGGAMVEESTLEEESLVAADGR